MGRAPAGEAVRRARRGARRLGRGLRPRPGRVPGRVRPVVRARVGRPAAGAARAVLRVARRRLLREPGRLPPQRDVRAVRRRRHQGLLPRAEAALRDAERRGPHVPPPGRAPLPNDAEYGNPPPCVWCAFDGAYVDENPNIWYLIHALTFNLPETLAPDQVGVLSALPLFLRMHQSCDLCRSHLHEHLVELDIPGDSRRAEDWARFFWRAHNFVNEQTQVTRCGSQECGWGSWTTPAAAHEPVGVYRNPWFMTYANAEKRWKHADE